jgi:glucose-1-phosphate thymidylyltransferase
MNEPADQHSPMASGPSRENGFKGLIYAGAGLCEIYPSTSVVPKALLPVYDKPLVYYALSVLMLGGVRQIALVTRPQDHPSFERLLGNGNRFGIQLRYLAEAPAGGPAQALLDAADFIGADCVAMIDGDCLLYGDGLQSLLSRTMQQHRGATVFAHPVANSEQHATIRLRDDGGVESIDDPGAAPFSNLAIMNVCFFEHDVLEVAKALSQSKPGSCALVDVQHRYLSQRRLEVVTFGRGFAWLDTRTPAALNAATNFIQTIESTHGLKIACLEEIALQKGWLTADQVRAAAASMNNAYGEYLARISRTTSGPVK